MITAFYSIIFIFIFSEIYHFYNKSRLDILFKNKDVNSIRKSDILFYVTKIFSIFWPIIGLFSSLNEFFLFLIIINLMKFIIYHVNDKLYKLYISLLHFINITIYLIILYYKFIH